MSEEGIVRYCSPTLAGLKTGNMYTCSYRNKDELRAFLRKWNATLRAKGVRLMPLRTKNGKALIYVYRPSKLRHDLSRSDACHLLSERGYCTDSCDRCVAKLCRRVCESEEFPHEIGLFLGYPCEDVRGFIENRADDCKLVGCWKVYGDADKAQKTFDRYKKCTRIYHRQWTEGKPISRLTVAR
ncbi:MAG: DUF3793 family protein [Ruminococcus sp.]|nr:DUF3793 family protein [Ruminococcus sp.]